MQGYGPKCGQVLGSGITRQDKEEILRVHNELRAKVANGNEKRGKPGPQPPAADMEQMVKLLGVHSWLLAPGCHIFYGLHSWSKLHGTIVVSSHTTASKLRFNCCLIIVLFYGGVQYQNQVLLVL